MSKGTSDRSSVGDHSGYSLADLVEAVRLPWEKFATWADRRMPERPPERPKPQEVRFEHGFHCDTKAWGDDYSNWCEVSLDVLVRALLRLTPDPWPFLQSALGVDMRTFSPDEIAATLQGRLVNLRAAMETAIEAAGRGEVVFEQMWAPGCAVSEDARATMRRATDALAGPDALERVFWTEIQRLLGGPLGCLESASRRVREGIPLDAGEIAVLDVVLGEGALMPMRFDGSQGTTIGLRMVPNPWSVVLRNWDDVLFAHATYLLIPVAFQICLAWQGSQNWPRYILTCRAPSCGRRFYSGRGDAVACPKKPHERATSPCKREWDKYKRWLQKIGRDPERDWDENGLRAQYLES